MLKERIRYWLARAIYYSGVYRLALWWQGRAGPYRVILAHHRAAGGHLRDHMRYLSRHYRLEHLQDALREFYATSRASSGAGRAVGRTNATDRRPILVLTSDDAYRDVYTHAFEYARELEIPITVVPVTGYVDSGAYFWWLAPDYLVSRTSVQSAIVDGREYRLGLPSQRAALHEAMVERLTDAALVDEREASLAEVQRQLEVSLPRRDGGQEAELELPAGWPELLEMARSELVSFGAHTVNHPVLARLEDGELKRDVEQSRQLLEARLCRSISVFAYPICKMSDVGETAVRAVREAGFSWAVTTIEGVNLHGRDVYLLKRLPGPVAVDPLVHVVQLVGLLAILTRLRKKGAVLRGAVSYRPRLTDPGA